MTPAPASPGMFGTPPAPPPSLPPTPVDPPLPFAVPPLPLPPEVPPLPEVPPPPGTPPLPPLPDAPPPPPSPGWTGLGPHAAARATRTSVVHNGAGGRPIYTSLLKDAFRRRPSVDSSLPFWETRAPHAMAPLQPP